MAKWDHDDLKDKSDMGGLLSGASDLLWNDALTGRFNQQHQDVLAQAAYRPDPEASSALFDMLKMRMRWGSKLPFKVTSCHRLSHDKAVVFVIHEDRHLTIEDDWALFPSDTLVTQLRLIQGTK
jgi:hypothetical protein